MRKLLLSMLAICAVPLSVCAQNWATHYTISALQSDAIYNVPSVTRENARNLTTFTATVGSVQTDLGGVSGTSYYISKLDKVVTVRPGQSITFATSANNVSWVHDFLYIDFNNLGFTVEDMVWHSPQADNNTSDTHNHTINVTVPSDTPDGFYRARFRSAWHDTDPNTTTISANNNNQKWPFCTDFVIHVQADHFEGITYPSMTRSFNNNLAQQNRYIAKVTTTGTLTPTVFEATTPAELPVTQYTTLNQNASSGAIIDKTANPIIVKQGTTSIGITYYAWLKTLAGNTAPTTSNSTSTAWNAGKPEPQWTCHAAYADWNRDGDFTDSDELLGQAWVDANSTGAQAFASATGQSQTITLPTGLQPGYYRMRVVLHENQGNGTTWLTTIWDSATPNMRNGVAYDFTIQVIPDHLSGISYPEMKRFYSGNIGQQNRYLKKAAASVDGKQTVLFECATEAELPPTIVSAITATTAGANINKTNTPLTVQTGTQDISVTFWGWNQNMNCGTSYTSKGSDMGWTAHVPYIDWNRDGDFTDSGENLPQTWIGDPRSTIVNNVDLILTDTGRSWNLNIPVGTPAGWYRMRSVFYEPSDYSSNDWHTTLFTSLNNEIRNGISYDFDLHILGYNVTAPDASDLDNVASFTIRCDTTDMTAGRPFGIPSVGTHNITISVTPQSHYTVTSLAVKGQDLTATADGTYTLNVTSDLTASDFTVTTESSYNYCTLSGDNNDVSRNNNNKEMVGRTIQSMYLKVDNAEQATNVQGLEYHANAGTTGYTGYGYHNLYADRTSTVVNVLQGDTITVNYTAKQSESNNYVSNMYGYFYIFNEDTDEYNAVCTPTAPHNFDATSGKSVFVIPADITSGQHRMRFKLDWNNIDACVSSERLADFKSMGGQIIDFTISVSHRNHISLVSNTESVADGGTIEIGHGILRNESDKKATYTTSDGEEFDILTDATPHTVIRPLRDGDVLREGQTYHVLVKTGQSSAAESAPSVRLMSAGDTNEYHLKSLTLDMGDGTEATNVMTQDTFTKLGTPSGSSQKYYTFSFTAPERSDDSPKEITISGEFENRPTTSVVETLLTDQLDATAEYYNMMGLRVSADNLTTGFYLVRKGGNTTKVFVRK